MTTAVITHMDTSRRKGVAHRKRHFVFLCFMTFVQLYVFENDIDHGSD